MERVDVAVVGAGQAGLATSHELAALGVEHVVLERGRVAQRWRDRWDSFCLVTPNWTIRLPGAEYDGPDPDGYLPRDAIVSHLEAYARAAPVREETPVTSVRRDDEGFVLDTTGGPLAARRLVLATGTYQRPHRPRGMDTLPPEIHQLDLDDYRREADLPPGRVLIVGSGQSGCQVAEELHEAGREVVLACGRAPWAPRRVGGEDLVRWIVRAGYMEDRLEDLPEPAARLWGNILASGHGGGHDLHLRTLRAIGVTLVGRFLGADGGVARFAPDLADSVSWGDEWYDSFRDRLREVAEAQGLEPPELPDPEPFDPWAPEELPLEDVGTVLLTGGYRPDYRSRLPWPEAFDDAGFPFQVDGASTVVPGLSFVGVHFMRYRRSSLLFGVGEDARLVAAAIAGGATDGPG